jgi:hypothetical protein
MSSDDAVSFTKDAGGAGSISLGLVPVETNKISAFPFEFAEKFSDDAVLSSDDAVLSKRGAGGVGSAGFASLGLIPADIDIALAFSIDLAEKFSDDAVLSSDDAVFSKRGAGGAGFASLDLIPVEIKAALVFPLALALAFSSGFLSIFFVDLVDVANWPWLILPKFCFSLFLDLNNPCDQNCICRLLRLALSLLL